MSQPLAIDDDAAWRDVASQWQIRPDTVYLNHGSFGPPPQPVRAARAAWIARLDEQPMDFFVRQFEPAWFAARSALANFVGVAEAKLVFVENATAAMNVVADGFPLDTGDEVLINDHEYGAVFRIWQRRCQRVGADLRIAQLPWPIEDVQQTVDAIFAAASPRTKLIVVSHITSATAVTLPVAEICRRAQRAGIAVAIDGPHAVAQLPLNIEALCCDFYTASCHKWLSAPFGAGFLYVAPQWQSQLQAPQLSWGRISPARIETWADEFVWSGTRDSSPYFSIPAAIDFLESIGLEQFRARTHWLARYARRKLLELTGEDSMLPDDPAWYGCMAHMPLPAPTGAGTNSSAAAADATGARLLQRALWQQAQIEVPVVEFGGRRHIRVSCHLYNHTAHINLLIAALDQLLRDGC